jgi:hypothetical protein
MDSVQTIKKKDGFLRLIVFTIVKITSTNKTSGIFSRSSENRTNCRQNLIIFPEYQIFTAVMFVRTTFSSSKM